MIKVSVKEIFTILIVSIHYKPEILYCFCCLLIKGSISPNLKFDVSDSCCLVLLVLGKKEIMHDET